MTTKAKSAEQEAHLTTITTELSTLCAELETLQARTLPIVEELDNWELENNSKFSWSPEVKAQFVTMRNLVTKI